MKKWAVLSLLSAAMFIIVIDTTIMNVSISALAGLILTGGLSDRKLVEAEKQAVETG